MHERPSAISWTTAALLLAAAIDLFARLRSPALLSFYEDDAFYYFQIARNIALHHFSSFDGIHPTNGYHPLWMAVLVILNLLASGKAFFVLLQAVTFASFVLSFFTARRLFRIFSSDLMLTQAAASAIALQCLLLLQSGMEVTLTLPLMLLLCWYRLRPQFRWTPRCAAGYGFLGALVALSRIDSLILLAILFFLDVALDRPATAASRRSQGVALLSGAAPVLLYALFNRVHYHVWMPISGLAKQLRPHHGFTLATIKISLGPINFPYWVFIVYPTLFVLLLALAHLLRARRLLLGRRTLAVSLSLIVFPFVQALAFWTLSDWPIWPWYLYSFPLAAVGCLLLLFQPSSATQTTSQTVARKGTGLFLQTIVTLLFFLLAWAGTVDRDADRTSWYLFGRDVEAFSKTHPGIYAMGDCAGTTGYLLHQPVVQLEGLVMDAPFLQNIREQRNLNQVLSSYNVRYYVTVNAERDGACYKAVEPALAGPDSPRMQGSFCQTPAIYPHGNRAVYIFDLKDGNHP